MKSARPSSTAARSGAPVNSDTDRNRPACSGVGEGRRAVGVQVVEADALEIRARHHGLEQRRGRGAGAMQEHPHAAVEQADGVGWRHGTRSPIGE